MKGRISVALAIAALGASTAYVLACAYELAVAGRGDPYLIVRDVHFGYYHRVALAAWVGGIAGIVAHAALATEPRVQIAEAWVTRAVLPLVVLLALGTFVFP